jgi:hypothetical protein
MAFAGQVVSIAMALIDRHHGDQAGANRWFAASLAFLAVVLLVEPQP